MKKVFDKPMTIKEIKKKTNNGEKYLSGDVAIDLTDIYDGHESFLNALSIKLVGNELLMDITYSVIGGNGTTVFFEVTGDVSEVIQFTNED